MLDDTEQTRAPGAKAMDMTSSIPTRGRVSALPIRKTGSRWGVRNAESLAQRMVTYSGIVRTSASPEDVREHSYDRPFTRKGGIASCWEAGSFGLVILLKSFVV